MLLKLLKYDFRAMWKRFSLIWGAALILALVSRFMLLRRFGEEILKNPDLLSLAVASVIMTMFVIAVHFVIDRFSKGLLGSEGYLMHTLPVRSWQLVLSKLICGAVTWAVSGVVACIAAFLMALPVDWPFLVEFRFWEELTQPHFWPYLAEAVSTYSDTLLLILSFCLLVLSVIIQFIAALYLAVSVGHLFIHCRRLVSVAAFIGLYVVQPNVWWFFADLVRHTHQRLGFFDISFHVSLLIESVTMLIPAAVFLAAVCWILDHKLNLE